MKTPLTYGALTALASALLTLVLFFAGYHSDPAKLAAVSKLATVLGIAITIVGIVLGIRAKRAETPLHEPFSYGKALGAGILTGLFAALFGVIFNLIYFQFINPSMVDVMIQMQTAQMEAKGIPAAQAEQAEKFMRLMFHPALQLVAGIIFGAFWATIVSLIAGAVLKRPAVATPPALAQEV